MNRPIKIVATGAYIPRQAIDSSAIDDKMGKRTGWTKRMFGIDTRYFAEKEETTSYMATKAAEQALENAGMGIKDIDCIVSACGVMEQPIPSTAVLVQHKLGLGDSGIAAFDVNSTCLSFVTAFDLIANSITLGQYKNVLIVSSEVASSGLDWTQPEAAAIFGDGAAAVIVTKSADGESSSLFAGHMETYGDLNEVCRLESGGTRLAPSGGAQEFVDNAVFKMDGRQALKVSLTRMPSFLDTLFAKTDTSLDEINLIVPHQASAISLAAMQKRLRIDQGKLVNYFSQYGNQIAASIPHALHLAISDDRLKRGNRFLMVGTSAGISLGGLVLEY